ncbi:subunit alpha of coatomer [Chloropicon primus]|uniref:Coatomer subunit alpha n=1 Tax=Chloropicon primus TaxID=1764295 RepID=A0A5B8MDE9_9CHLO|nr:subunit alpha of coatomer [Chloropicon primus]UPQ97666.1 subunit alpha of coatomer [Chloropicon primus]|mmetsp:Transcript_237/g.558  ORF Transcript_237/g.558 Transcript_237/m.558 type:complete len:1233 (-) Transcript_237:2047-5745(-)|eukprot:QDZ18457.1 subunit alpha of coatomer [Chloropicon primus]
MLTKFETKSNRVKGLSFHPKRPWILASLHSGVIQLWDYRMGTLIDRFEEHDGPVRGVDFHSQQPLFVSGGDDYKIKVWNHKLRRCLFTLVGHLDYIRMVQFHKESPWIVSASDDQTIRVWNWQSRTCLSVLTGHNHYVMCASFHPKEDLVVSASLDQTVRVWDISGLKKKSVSPNDDGLKLPQVHSELFGGGDAIVKYVLEGHDRGVNWASFHPSLPLIVSGADDRQVKLWRMNDTKAWEVDTLRGHSNNVSCVMFHAKQDVIISNSEDKSIRVWDMSKRTGVQTFRRENDRFWILAIHPEVNLLAAGHDSGMVVFKLERERPAFATHAGSLYFVKDRFLRLYDYSSQRETPLVSLRRGGGQGLATPRSLAYNPAENAVLLSYDGEGGMYELYLLPRDTSRGEVTSDAGRGQGSSACFVARNRFAVLDKNSNTISVKNLQNETTKRCPAPTPTTDAIFYGGTGLVLCKSEDKMVMFDVQQRTVVGELSTPSVKYVVWNAEMTMVAFLCKHAVILSNKKLTQSHTIHESIRVKSGAWDDSGVFLYTTLNHIKYCLPNGDNGIVKTLNNPVYLTKVFANTIFCLDRDGKTRQIQIDSTEYIFKLALLQKKYDQVIEMIRSSQLCGQAIINYLQKKGFPEIALHFVENEQVKFKLAIECGNLEVALQSASELDDEDTWHHLGVEALRQGNFEIVEFAYQKCKNFERLSFLYLITGHIDKLKKMVKIAEMRKDIMGQFHNSLYLGDVKERVKILKEVGQMPLAYVTAKTHGLEEEAEEIAAILTEQEIPIPAVKAKGTLMLPPTPIVKAENWPLLQVAKTMFDGVDMDNLASGADNGMMEMDGGDEENGGAWGGDDLDLDIPGAEGDFDVVDDEDELDLGDGDGGWEMEDLDLPEDVAGGASLMHDDEVNEYSHLFRVPTSGVPAAQKWAQKCNLIAEHASSGSFDTAMRMLNRQLGIVDFEPLKQYMVDLATASHGSFPTYGGFARLSVPLEVDWQVEKTGSTGGSTPLGIYSTANLEGQLKVAYKLFTGGKFTDALEAFLKILHMAPFLNVASNKEEDDVKELITIASEYIQALLVEMTRRAEAGKPARQAELAAYFTHFNLQPIHLTLTLRQAMSTMFKLKNFNTAAGLCHRMLELNPPPKIAQQARQVLAACEKNPTDAVEVNYDPRNPFVICSGTQTPIYRGDESVSCPMCGAKYLPKFKGSKCSVCKVASVGASASGLSIVRSLKKKYFR